ncbi:hypothetical protein [Peribacillus frigoritolerans]|jgi:hypothetical protein|uniref:hypothetical protein n=1 Tax=Peribacillus frigoritolerans TaxID=450367 RepID=UPI00227FD60B|nr:hypothetical protein [Peribacillus frigoritolerans]MCY9003263.1 hypothetical protein [Peribacillus frigoritolerans]
MEFIKRNGITLLVLIVLLSMIFFDIGQKTLIGIIILMSIIIIFKLIIKLNNKKQI